MARKKEHGIVEELFDILMASPWWIGPLLALAAFLFCRFAIPPLLSAGSGGAQDVTNMSRQVFAGLAVTLAPWIGGFVLFCWAVTEGKKFANRRLLDQQSGLDSIGELSWQEFEELIGEAYRRQGYAVEHTGSDSGDGGIDLLLRRDAKTTFVQCKHWKTWRVGVKEVRELRGIVASEGAHCGIVVTYGTFTDEAIAFARKNPITLVAGPELEQMIRSVQQSHTKTSGRNGSNRAIESIAGDSAVDVVTSASPVCPLCGAAMVERTAKRGNYAGQAFWGCRRYPACVGERQM